MFKVTDNVQIMIQLSTALPSLGLSVVRISKLKLTSKESLRFTSNKDLSVNRQSFICSMPLRDFIDTSISLKHLPFDAVKSIATVKLI